MATHPNLGIVTLDYSFLHFVPAQLSSGNFQKSFIEFTDSVTT